MAPFSKNLALMFFYHKTHFIAILDSSHQVGSICQVKNLLHPKFDQVMILLEKSCFGDPKLSLESPWALALPNKN